MRDIYSIEKDIAECVMLDPESGEDLGTDWERLDALQMEREQKLENVAVWFKNTKAEFEAVKAEEDKLRKRKQALANRMDGIKAYLMLHLEGENISSGRVKTGYHTTKDVVELDEGFEIPEAYQRVTIEPNKTAIKDAIKGGAEIPGARLVNKVSVTVR